MEGKGRYIPNELTNRRLQKNLRQQDAAEILGVTQKQLSMWETGKASPSLEHLISLCVCYGSDVRGLYPELCQASLLRIAKRLHERVGTKNEETEEERN